MNGKEQMPIQVEEDARSLMEEMDGDAELAAEMAQLFFRTAAEQIDGLRAGLAGNDLEQIVFKAHKCAGGACACGFERLAEQLARLEHEARGMDPVALAAAIEEIARIYDETREGVLAFLDEALWSDV